MFEMKMGNYTVEGYKTKKPLQGQGLSITIVH
jgi:hypothetical protein